MIQVIKIVFKLSKNTKLNFFLFFIFTSIATILETFSIGIILPLTQSIMSSGQNYSFVLKSVKYFEIPIQNIFIIFIFLIILKNIYLVFYYWWISKFTWDIYSSSSIYLLRKYLSNDFFFFKKNDASKLVQNVYIETKNFIGTLQSSLTIIFETLVLISIIFLLIFIQFKTTLLTLFIFASLMFLYHKLFSKILTEWGTKRAEFSTNSLKILNEIFSGIKTIKIFSIEQTFTAIFSGYIKTFSSVATKHSAFMSYPKIVIELSAIIILAAIFIFTYYSTTELKNMIPYFGVFAFAAFRLLPSVNKLMISFSNISFYRSSIDIMAKESNKFDIKINNVTEENILFQKEIKIKNLTFSHNQKDIIYKNENIIIEKFDCVGIYGKSGSGKTTLVDIIMGLYKPDKGELLVDNKKISSLSEIKSWQKKISYVPQSIFLFNGSIKNNISFEFNDKLIDSKKVSQSLISSQLKKFTDQPEKIDYIIDEGGGNLSTGEKQRIGIARALYKDPELIILDEPTSALDNDTAKNLIKFLEEFKKNKTLIIISHDLNSLRFCNKIYEIKQSDKSENKIFLKDSVN
jgi:ABC-type multidrug transport system fused ATPase/permease subunit